MFSLDEEYLLRQSVPLTMMSNILRTLGQYQGKQALLQHQRPQLIKTLKEIAIIQSSESSNRIEGINVDPKRLEPLLKQRLKPKDRSEAQVLGYRNVLADIHANYNKIDLTPQTILRMHKQLFKFTDLTSGEWKTKNNTIEERLSDGTWITRFEPVSAQQTPVYMQELCQRFNRLWTQSSIDRLIIIFAFIFDFLCIHPFTDGNGRISRLLCVLLLHKADVDVTRYISYERLVEDTKDSYYEILHEVSQDWHQGQHRLIPWLDYNLGLLVAAYKELDERVDSIDSEKGSKTAWLLELIDEMPTEFNIGELVRLCPGISRPMIRHVLENLRREGKLESLGTGRSAKWRKLV